MTRKFPWIAFKCIRSNFALSIRFDIGNHHFCNSATMLPRAPNVLAYLPNEHNIELSRPAALHKVAVVWRIHCELISGPQGVGFNDLLSAAYLIVRSCLLLDCFPEFLESEFKPIQIGPVVVP
jgi:hypothetical protein